MTEASAATGRPTEASAATGRATEASGATGRPTEASAATGNGSVAVSADDRPVLARHVRLRFDATRDRHVLLMPETVVALNPTGADILMLCDGGRTVAEIVAELSARYDRVVDDEVAHFLDRLVRRRCVRIGGQ